MGKNCVDRPSREAAAGFFILNKLNLFDVTNLWLV